LYLELLWLKFDNEIYSYKMSSIIAGYNYDIFISYRQKDNKGDRWVSEFVEALKIELESTFKEEISVYFDINPHDGLLETHDVDASLKDKLKCLIFVPIISRTYCDPKSFAWEHEFKAFVEQASLDQFGLKVKLPTGNVAGRVLPVSIYDLDLSDRKLVESVLAGNLRGIEFIYKEQGVNRPLKPDDDEKINLNKTKYRNQINKVGNAIKEIISGLRSKPAEPKKEKFSEREPFPEVKIEDRIEAKENPVLASKTKLLSTITVISIVIIAAIIAYPKIFNRNTLDKLRSSGGKIAVAVLPFQNMTNDTSLNIWQRGIQDNLINSLSNSEDLKVRQTESTTAVLESKGLSNYASISPSDAYAISRKLETDIFVYGSIKTSGNTLRINAQLIDSKSNDVFKSFQIEGPSLEILHLIDSLSWMVKNFLVISKMERDQPLDFKQVSISTTNSTEAYKYFIYGQQAFITSDFATALKMYSQALALDSNYTDAAIMLPFAYRNQNFNEQAKKLCLKIYNKRDQTTMRQKMYINWLYATFFETPYETIKYAKQILELDDQTPTLHQVLAINYIRLKQYDKAVQEAEKALDIYKNLDSRPSSVWVYTILGSVYHKTGEYNKEAKLYKKAELDFPDNIQLIPRQAILSLTTGDTSEAKQYIGKFIRINTDNLVPEINIKSQLAEIYSEAGLWDKAEYYYRQALTLNPENPRLISNLAYFLIDNNRNVNEGLELIDKALKTDPDNFVFLSTKGWGLYKQGKYKDALVLLQKSDSLKPFYNHEIYLKLEAAKKAVASQKKSTL
jgi:tetratricopeptide (TPR) repeat protein/TolB-like protein